MKQIKLIRLKVQNFKGLRDFDFVPNGATVSIYGRNGLGKSTLADATNWLLFDKDSHGAKDFGLKPYDEDGKEINNLEHIAVGEFEIADFEDFKTDVTFRKVLTEKWAKKRGSSSPEFSGHETAYFINEVPKTKAEYDAFVAGICGTEEVFRLLTSTIYFNSLKWVDQRKILLSVAGDISDEAVIQANPQLAELIIILNGRSISDHIKTIKAQRPKVNDAIDQITPRIAEAGRDKPSEISTIPPAGNYADLKSGLQSLQNQKAAILAGDTSEISAKIISVKEDVQAANESYNKKKRVSEEEKRKFEVATERAQANIVMQESLVRIKGSIITSLEKEMQQLRDDFAVEKAKPAPNSSCSLCGQELPPDQIEATLKKFNTSKAESLKAINEKGVAKSKELAGVIAEQNEIEKKIKNLNDELQLAKESAETVVFPVELYHTERLAEIERLEKEIASKSTHDTEKIDKQIGDVQMQIISHDTAGLNLRRANEIDARIVELKAEKKKYAQKLEQIDKEIMLCEDFTRAKVSMLTESVNSKFSPLSFKLFDQQINGGIAETCEVMMNGVPYSDLSRGQKAIAGLSIIKVLSDHYGVSVPVFVDDAEGITLDLPLVDGGQYIELCAHADYDELTVRSVSYGEAV